jgi:hypothetical protein
MCWNSRGWRLPTNTSVDGGYPSRMGFGHEEWNFQIEDEVDGYVYAYLYFNPAQRVVKESKGYFRIGFWSLHPTTRERLLVGIYNDAELSTNADLDRVDQVFRARKIYERRASELSTVVDNIDYGMAYREILDSVQKKWLNFKCPVDKVQGLQEYVPVEDFLKSSSLGLYFARPTYISADELPDFPKRISPVSTTRKSRQPSKSLAEDGYYRESKQNLARIIPRHNKLSNAFADWLRKNGFINVVQENNYVDVTFEKNEIIFRAELKVCYGVGSTKAIREALGQLLEYNYYLGREPADKWVIILDEKASRDDITYVELLKKEFRMPLYLGWQEEDAFLFADNLKIL